MFFTKVGNVIAWLIFGLGVFSVASGYAIVLWGEQEMARELFAAPSTGTMIDKGLIWLLIGVALGILVEISRSVALGMEAEDIE